MIDSFTTTNPTDDNFDAKFHKIVPCVCKKNHPLYVVYKLSYASSEIQKQCKYCGNVVYIGTDTEEELKKIPTWFTPSDAEDRCGMLNGVIKVVRDANLNGTNTAVVAYVDPRSNETMASLTVNIGFKWQDYDAGEDAWEDEHKGRCVQGVDMTLENSQNKMVWHPYKDCGDAPNVAEYQKDVFLCKVQMYHSDNDEPVGTPVYNVLLCDDGGIFYGYRKNEGDCYNKVIAWTEIIG